MNPLDVPFDQLKFRLEGARGSYGIVVRHLCSRSLHPGLLEFLDVDPVDFAETLSEMAFQVPERIFGRLCAAVLQSFDPFPVPFEGENGPEPADYAEACVIYTAGCSEGVLPESARALIRWEVMARPLLM